MSFMLLWTDTTAFGSFRMVMMCYKQCQTRYQTCVNSCELIEIIDDVSEKVGDEGDCFDQCILYLEACPHSCSTAV
jgi:hypothetical protein